jgi:UDP-N-acetyl-2-amino-2-deoxyglucuronate dehydrogenase
MNFCIIGLGFISPRHKKAIEDVGGKLLLTCDIDPSKGADFTDWVEMFHSPRFKEVDVVVICTPNYLHAVIAREATLRNKRVICEKPLSISGTEGLYGVNTVLQLRYHPKLQGLTPKNVSVTAKMFRDESYWKGWKGDVNKSGGILYNLGVHYIDLLIFLLGYPVSIIESSYTPKLAKGKIQFHRGIGEYHIEILDDREGQMRKIIADGEEIGLSDKDNLSYEDLHLEVYKHFLAGQGITYGEERKSIELVSKLMASDENCS